MYSFFHGLTPPKKAPKLFQWRKTFSPLGGEKYHLQDDVVLATPTHGSVKGGCKVKILFEGAHFSGGARKRGLPQSLQLLRQLWCFGVRT